MAERLLLLEAFGAFQGGFHQVDRALQTGFVEVEEFSLGLVHSLSPWKIN